MLAAAPVDPEYMRLDTRLGARLDTQRNTQRDTRPGGRPGAPARPRLRTASATLLVTVALAALGATTAAAGLDAHAKADPHTGAATQMLVVDGAGDGHGVGMSQDGALGYAEHGYGYAAILAHYYSGTALGKARAGTTVRVLLRGKVRRLGLEAYVRGVVGAEMPSSWPPAALEAQAVASRTYALTDHAGGARFDVYADTRSQVYLGAKAQTAQTDAAVSATAGQIVTYAGHPVITYFFASSGGATEDVQYGFPGTEPAPWLVGVPDPFEQGPANHWSVSIPFAIAAARLRGLYRGAFEGVQVLRRGYSPRIVTASVLGSAGAGQVSGAELAGCLGLQSTWAYFSVRSARGVAPEPEAGSGAPVAGGAGAPATAGGAPAGNGAPGPTGGATATDT